MNPLFVADDDPRDWSIDQVVYELCHCPSPRWLPENKPLMIPDRPGLEDALRRNDIDGDNLLALDIQILKEDLGIPSFGRRRAIMKAVEFFRANSKGWQQKLLEDERVARMEAATYASPQTTHSRTSIIPQSPAQYGLGVQPPSPTIRLLNHPPDVPHPKPSPSAHGLIDDLASKTRDQPLPMLQQPTREYAYVNGKKKIAPTFISHLPEASPVKSGDDSYLGRDALPLQDVFYYKVSTGLNDEFFYRVGTEEPDSFGISADFPAGQRRTIARLMKSFLRQGTTALPRSRLIVKLPYEKSRVNQPYSEQYFTLFPPGSDRARVHKVEDFPELKALQENQSPGPGIDTPRSNKTVSHEISLDAEGGSSNLSDLNYLLDKYPVESSDGLPLYGDSGDENDLDEDTWKEIEEEKAEEEELRRKSANMTPDEVEVAMNEAILEWKEEWRETKLFGVQKKAYRHWMNAARDKRRHEKIEYFNFSKNQFLHRLENLKREIAGNVWRKPAEVKRQCQSLELTVYQHQEYEYYSQVMLRDTPPEKPKNMIKAIRTEKQHDLEDGEELLESDSETFSENWQSFVDDDDDHSSDEGSIHHIPDTEDWNPIIPSTARQPDLKALRPKASPKTQIPANIRESPVPDINANDADVETETDDDIITPARRRTKRIKTEVTQTPDTKRPHVKRMPQQSASDTSDLDRSPRISNSRYRNKGRSADTPVDLTFTSPSGLESNANDTSTDFSVRTPELNPTRVEIPKKRSKDYALAESDSESEHMPSKDDTSLPGVFDVRGLKHIPWSDIDPIDKRRALAKAVYDLESDAVTKLADFLESIANSLTQEMVVIDGLVALDKEEAIAGVKPKHQLSARLLVLLYFTYICGQNALAAEFELSEAHRDQAFKDKDTALIPFYNSLRKIVQTYFRNQTKFQPQTKSKKRKRDQESFSIPETGDDSITDITLTDSFEEAQPPSHKKRKRKVEESQEARAQQYNDKVRIQEQEERRKNMAQKLALMQVDGSAVHIINTEEPVVELHQHIAQRVKPHQVSGIQFMWREIIEDPKHQGCILAHTMGLGKTMQVVSLLVTIALCNQSKDQNVRNHIPEHLRKSKTLILCPPALLNNWEDELLMWTPNPTILGAIHKADAIKKQENIRAITAWSKQGGVLLMGYERFRRSIIHSINAREKGTRLSVDLEKILLEEPNLVIADEAHTLKNAKSKISQIAKRLTTTSRIALSGSPLNNHLEEYHTMVDWIAPGYLGDMVQFRSKYSEPIMEGLYSDSTPSEKRLSLRKLHVLKRDLDPKINRADISAIEKDMPSKTEYFITIPLTDLQRQAYDIYVGHMLQSFKLMGTKSQNMRTLHWLAMLSWLCHHPAGFVTRMQEREKTSNENQQLRNQVNDSEPNDSTDETSALVEASEDITIDVTGPLQEAMQQVLQILPDVSDRNALYDPSLSYRTIAVKRILEKAIEAGDKTLIFSHSIPTLNYLGQMLKGMKVSFCRIDGDTKVSDRQAFTKEFNQKDNYQVFLISMRAGGLGLNLQGANRVIIFDFSFNPTWEQQAIGRAYRLNQKRPVFVYRFQAGGTFEDKLFNTSVFKTQLFGRVVDKKNPRRHASKAAHTEYLFPVRDIPQVDFGESLGRDPKVLDAIIHELTFVRSIVLTETFQKEDDEQLNDEDQKVAEEEYNDQRLQREDPVAWQAKQDALLAGQRTQQHPLNNVSGNPTVHYTAPALGQKTGLIAKRARYSLHNSGQVPFGRARLNAPQQPQPIHKTFHPPGSYDDTFQDFAPGWDGPRRAASTEPDVSMS